MSDSSIYTVPYFYIIEHIQTGKRYAGSKWAKGSNPDSFMKDGGYLTSSKSIHGLIKTCGLESFRIVELLTEKDCGEPVYEYESKFLQNNNIADDDMWLNFHNNDSAIIPYGCKEHREIIKRKYGVENVSQSPDIDAKKVETCLTNHGVKYPMQSVKIRLKSKSTVVDKYGVNNISELDEVKTKKRSTSEKNYGVSNPMQSSEVKDKLKKSLLESHGVSNPMHIPEAKMKLEIIRKQKKEREIVYTISATLKTLGKKPKDFGYSNVWMFQSDEVLDIFFKKLS